MTGELATSYAAWKKLEQLKSRRINLREAFATDPERFARFSREFTSGDVSILLDYSKNLIDDEIWAALLELAAEAEVEGQRDALFRGEHVNVT